ncbi:MAG: 3-keto-5-aminohexanoate cleavage protein [Candidatus Freyarchaeota archaeon]|nr:3-keto-5-aminohexanoate cleavage protein [Candidatus Jordarchaeia archaeon]MBS7281218.1 3-keto-5-aminohexanoate cleavage protein [Candidatus Jordarchaeia archaeon]
MGEVNWEWVEQKYKEEGPEFKSLFIPYGLPEITDITVTEFGPTKGVEVQPKWDIPEEVIITVAVTGAFYSKRQNPTHPITPEEIRGESIDALKAGASSVHIHARDKAGYYTLDPEIYHKIIDPIRKDYPKALIDGCLVPFSTGDWERFERLVEDKIFDISPVNPTACYAGDTLFAKPPHVLIKKTKAQQDAGIKPQVAIYTDGDVDNANRYLIKTGLLEKPYYWIILPTLPGGSPMYDPKTMVEGLMRIVNLIHKIDDESVIMVCAAGRASSYLTTLAMLLGLHIRVGKEDTIYRWPHKDDRIQTNADAFKMAATIAENLGRKVATYDQYRKMVGMK